jgi:predicted transcriptional regulator of viral defense system
MDSTVILVTSVIISILSAVYGLTDRQPNNAFVEVPTGKE